MFQFTQLHEMAPLFSNDGIDVPPSGLGDQISCLQVIQDRFDLALDCKINCCGRIHVHSDLPMYRRVKNNRVCICSQIDEIIVREGLSRLVVCDTLQE